MKVTIDIVTDRPPRKSDVRAGDNLLGYSEARGWSGETRWDIKEFWMTKTNLKRHLPRYLYTAWAILPPQPPGESDDE